MNVYITTSDRFSYLVPGFAYMFNKYWSPNQKVIVLGYENLPSGLPDNFEVVSLGKQLPDKIWTDPIIDYFKKSTEEYFLHIVEDAFIINSVDNDLIYHLLGLCKKLNVPKIELGGVLKCYNDNRDIPYDYFYQDEKVDAGSVPGNLWGIKNTLHPSIWNREYFLAMLKPNRTIWQVETRGGKEIAGDGRDVLSIFRPWPVIDTSNVWRGCQKGGGSSNYHDPKSAVGVFQQEDILHLKKTGVFK